MNEKIYKNMGASGAASLVIGIIVAVIGIAAGVISIVSGCSLLKNRKNIMI